MIGSLLIGLCAIALSQSVPSCPDNSVELLPHEDCTKFYQCSHGAAVEHICPDGLYFNPTTKRCDWPESSSGCAQSFQVNKNEVKDLVDPEEFCAGDNTHGKLIPHKECNKFYECSYGHAFVLECPSGLLFNTVSGKCDWAENVDCGERQQPSA